MQQLNQWIQRFSIRHICFIFWLFIEASSLAHAGMPYFYSEPGINPYRERNQQNDYENVDPFTGKVQLHNTDTFLPGNGGMDIEVTRSYTSANGFAKSTWTMNFGYVQGSGVIPICSTHISVDTSTSPILVLPDGSKQILSDIDGQNAFISTQHYRATCAPRTNGLIVTSPEGKIYEMTYSGSNNEWYPVKITDKNGNWISISYQNPNGNGVQVTRVSSSDGRTITYAYVTISPSYQVLQSISDGTRTFYYYFVQGESVGTYLLSQVTQPDGTTWQYTYNGNLGTNAGSYQLRSVKNPRGLVTNYAYGRAQFNNNTAYVADHVITSKTVSGVGTWTYTYQPASGNGGLDTTVVNEPTRTIVYRHFGYNSSNAIGDLWRIGLLYSKTIGSIQSESYTWTPLKLSSQFNVRMFDYVSKRDQAFYSPVLASKTIVRDGTTYATSYSGFDAWGNPSTITESGNSTRTIYKTYNVNTSKWILHDLASYSIGGLFPVTFGFDSNGNVISENKYGVMTRYGRNSSGDINTITDARGKVKTFPSYVRGVPIQEILPDGANILRQVSNTGLVTSETDGVGARKGYTYDTLNRITSITTPINNSISISWGATYRVLTRGNYRETTTYDGYGKPVRIDNADLTTGAVITRTITYDAAGRKNFESLPGSSSGTSYSYDVLNRVTRISYADGSAASYSYSPGNVVNFTNPRGYVYTHSYRAYGDPDQKALMSIAAPVAAASVSISRNAINLPTQVAQNGIARSFGYSSQGFLVAEVNPETGTTTYGRDAVGNMSSKAVGASATTSYGYDGLNRLTSISYPSPTPSVSYTYDKAGQMLTAVSGVITKSYAYDLNRNLTSETLSLDSGGYQAKYGYNGNDYLNSITYPSNQVVTYTLDAFGRQSSISPYVSAVTWHPSGQPSKVSLANGVTTEYSYQSRYWPNQIWVYNATSNLMKSNYTYDAFGNVTNISDLVDAAYNRALTFDGIDRLSNTNSNWGSDAISYDPNGNITSQSYSTYVETYSYDANNRLSSASGGSAYTLTYDTYGNVISNGRTTFSYDDALNMRCSNCAGANKVQYDYDANRYRAKKLVDTQATYSFYGLGNILLGEYTPATQESKEYIYLGSKLLALKEASSAPNPTITYYHDDIVGSPQQATNESGAVKWRENYRPYGSRTINDTNATGNRLWFAGKPYDNDTGVSYFGSRLYDPLLGRFMGMDPAGFDEKNIHSFNRYGYGNNNPYHFTDPDGNSPIDVLFLANDVVQLGVAAYTGVGVGPAAVDAAISAASIFSPVPGVGEAYKAGRTALDVARDVDKVPFTELGVIYKIDRKALQSGRDYVGKSDDLARRASTARDGRPRDNAEVIGYYPKGDRKAGSIAEQKAMNKYPNGVEALDNKRNEVASKYWSERGISNSGK